MTQSNFTLEHCKSMNDFERIDKCNGGSAKNSMKINSCDKISLKTLTKYDGCGTNTAIVSSIPEVKSNGNNNNNCYGGSQSCRNFQ
jgi:hypothetical protein